MQRMLKYGCIQNISVDADKETNISIYRTLSYLIIYRNYKLQKWSSYWPTLYILVFHAILFNITQPQSKYAKVVEDTPILSAAEM